MVYCNTTENTTRGKTPHRFLWYCRGVACGTHVVLKYHRKYHREKLYHKTTIQQCCGTYMVQCNTTENTTRGKIPHRFLWYCRGILTKMSCGIPVVFLWYYIIPQKIPQGWRGTTHIHVVLQRCSLWYPCGTKNTIGNTTEKSYTT